MNKKLKFILCVIFCIVLEGMTVCAEETGTKDILEINGKLYTLCDVPEEMQNRKGFVWTEETVGGHKVNGWKYENSDLDRFIQLYLQDSRGNFGLYQYDLTDRTLIRYDSNLDAVSFIKEASDVNGAETDSKKDTALPPTTFGIAFSAASLAGGIVMIVWFERRMTKGRGKKSVSESKQITE